MFFDSLALQTVLVLSFYDLKLKYQGSVLGFFWSFFKPLLLFLVYFFVFSVLLKVGNGMQYAFRLFYGVLLWNWFSESTGFGMNAFIGKKSIITKIKINKSFILLASYLTPFFSYTLNFSVFLFVYFVGGNKAHHDFFTLYGIGSYFLSLATISVIIISINTLLSNLNILYRDTQTLWELVLTYGMFVTPIVYEFAVPEKYELLYYCLNPLALPILKMKAIFFGSAINIHNLGLVRTCHTCTVAALFILALYVHKSLHSKAVDSL